MVLGKLESSQSKMSMEKHTLRLPICNISFNMSDIILHRHCQTEINKQLFSGAIFKQPNECIPLNILIVMLKYSALALKQPLQ